ncbi:hypothetical protein E2C01_010094 [Portunus trituberculatus]|uniref:Uncharacterized protein n=1 Tax=Portunus trituberculatus TaxID=210409 RepID=A0A5B7D7K1_PORTR|nr:hypothetical protein [Portunus trituberculatus]
MGGGGSTGRCKEKRRPPITKCPRERKTSNQLGSGWHNPRRHKWGTNKLSLTCLWQPINSHSLACEPYSPEEALGKTSLQSASLSLDLLLYQPSRTSSPASYCARHKS